MNRAGLQSLLTRGAKMRQDLFGADQAGETQQARMESGTAFFDCYFSPVRSQEQLDAVGFQDVHDTILRVNKSVADFVPTIGKLVRLMAARPDGTDLVVRISELGYTGVNPEYVVGCKSEF